MAWPIFGALASVAALIILWQGRGQSYSSDELVWLSQSPHLDLGGALDPYNGHLLLVTRLVYKAILETFGAGYLPFRLLTLASVVLMAALFFAYVSRRIGAAAALAPTAVLLLFGSDFGHLITGNGFTVLFSLSCGLGALLMLDRGDRVGDLSACGLLCLGVATYSVALAFVVGVGVGVLLGDDRRRRIWIAAGPAALYTVWWLWAQGSSGDDPQNQVALENILLLPSWGYQSLSTAVGTLSGLDLGPGDIPTPEAGPTLAVLAVAALAWRLVLGRVPRSLWVALGVLIALWALGALVSGPFRRATDPRYLYPVAVVVLVVGASAATRVSWTRNRLLVIYAIAAVGVAANLWQLQAGAAEFRARTSTLRTELGALDAAGPAANANADLAGGGDPLPFNLAAFIGPAPVASYLTISDRYGQLGYSDAELAARPESDRALADRLMVAALGIGLTGADHGAQRVVARSGRPTVP